MRKYIVAGNWKMYKTPVETKQFVTEFAPAVQAQTDREILFFAPAVNLTTLIEATKGTNLKSGAQNCHWEKQGAFTGETSPATLFDIGLRDCLVGHSERRTLFHETDAETGKKVTALLALKMRPMLCVGETIEERKAGKTIEVIIRQLRAGLAHVTKVDQVVLAYEPVWAIGTGLTATPEQANEAHVVLRKDMTDLLGMDFAEKTPILYGGSVKPDNVVELSKKPQIDGFLVGGASLKPADFKTICTVPR